jgi:hypothetical protein
MLTKPSFLASLSLRPSFRGLATLSAVSALSLLAAGCDSSDDDENQTDAVAAEQALDASESGQGESALLAASIDGLVLGQISTSPNEVSASISGRFSARFQPAGCATAAVTNSTINVAFDNCAGPRGLERVDGTLTLGVANVTLTSITLTANADDFQINNSVINIDNQSTYALQNGALTLTVDSNSSGVGPFGHELAHTAQYQASWDGNCTNIEGQWSTSRDGNTRSTTVDVSRCDGAGAGGTITRVTRDGREIDITLDGDALPSGDRSAG